MCFAFSFSCHPIVLLHQFFFLQLKGRVCPLCLVPDDSVFLTIALANLCETSHVISLFPGLREKGAKYLRAVASENGYSMDRIEVLDKGKDNLTMGDTHQKKVSSLQFQSPMLCQT